MCLSLIYERRYENIKRNDTYYRCIDIPPPYRKNSKKLLINNKAVPMNTIIDEKDYRDHRTLIKVKDHEMIQMGYAYYKTGFHLFSEYRHAKQWIGKSNRQVIVKVIVKSNDVLVSGEQGKDKKAVVVQRMKIVKIMRR